MKFHTSTDPLNDRFWVIWGSEGNKARRRRTGRSRVARWFWLRWYRKFEGEVRRDDRHV